MERQGAEAMKLGELIEKLEEIHKNADDPDVFIRFAGASACVSDIIYRPETPFSYEAVEIM